jgi:hypothetical protein
MKPNMKRILLPVLVVAALGMGVAQAKECEGVSFPDQAQVDGSNLTLNGLGMRQATALKVNVYVAALYVARPSSDANALLASVTPSELILPRRPSEGMERRIRKERQGPAPCAEGAHRGSQRLDDRRENRRPADVHS